MRNSIERRWLEAVVSGGLMAAIAAAFQLGPIYLPSVGLLLAILSSLPIALQAYRFPRTALPCAIAATLVILTLSTQEALIFGCTAAPFGLSLGYTARWRWSRWQAVVGAALPLLGGILLLAYRFGFPPLGPEVKAAGAWGELAIYGIFPLLWSALWHWFFGLLLRRIKLLSAM